MDTEPRDFDATLLEVEATTRRIAGELARMKKAADLLEESAQRSVELGDSVGNLVIEIRTLVELAGRITDGLLHVDMEGMVSELKEAVMQRFDALDAGVRAEAAELAQDRHLTVMHRLDALGSQMADMHDLMEQQSKRKGLLF